MHSERTNRIFAGLASDVTQHLSMFHQLAVISDKHQRIEAIFFQISAVLRNSKFWPHVFFAERTEMGVEDED